MERSAVLVSRHLGEVEWDPGSELHLPAGLPGFESERRMVAVEVPAQRPLVYLQSVDRPEICFVALPALVIRPDFELVLGEDERSALKLEGTDKPAIGSEVLCLALLFPGERGFEANLGAPVVVNLQNLRCVQAQTESEPLHYRLDVTGKWVRSC